MAKNKALALAARINDSINKVNDTETRVELADILCDLINHANGHTTWLNSL